MLYSIGLYTMSALYIVAGLNHFRAPKFYLGLMPPWIPLHREMVFLSGAIEVALGILLLIPETRAVAAWAIILMLIVFFSVHIYMVQERQTVFAQVPEALIWARLPLQLVLIAWAYFYTS